MNCPKCQEGTLLYARRGVIEELYKTDENGDPTGEIVKEEKDFFYNPHHYCTDCEYSYDVTEKEEV